MNTILNYDVIFGTKPNTLVTVEYVMFGRTHKVSAPIVDAFINEGNRFIVLRDSVGGEVHIPLVMLLGFVNVDEENAKPAQAMLV